MSIHPPFVFQSEDKRPLDPTWVSSTDASQCNSPPTLYTIFELLNDHLIPYLTLFIIHQINHKVKEKSLITN